MSRLRELIVELEAKEAELLEREAAVAQALEQLSQGPEVQNAHRCGQQEERGRLVALIDLQLDQLNRGGVNATCLQTLRRMVLEVDEWAPG